MEMLDVLNNGVWKFNIAHWLVPNNYSKIFLTMCFKDEPQRIFFDDVHRHISL